MIIKFSVIGNPVAKGRPKFFRKGNFVGTYTPKKTKDHEESVLMQALPHKLERPIDVPIKLTMVFYMVIPISLSKKKREMAISGELRPTKRPDLDNLAKVIDSLNKVMWVDDSLIVEQHMEKVYSENPRTEIIIESLSTKNKK